MRMYLNKSFKRVLILLILVTGVLGSVTQGTVEGQVVSGTVNPSEEIINIKDPTSIMNDGSSFGRVSDDIRGLIYYTVKDPDRWGSKEYINVYSILEDRIIKQIKFDNSGYYKYPISLSPNSKYLVIAESAQSIGEVGLSIIDLENGSEQKFTELVYSPSIVWVTNSKYVYMSVEQACGVRRGCSHTSINLKEYEIGGRSKKVKKIAGKLDNGTLPSINNLKIESDTVIFEDSITSTKRVLDLSTKIISIL